MEKELKISDMEYLEYQAESRHNEILAALQKLCMLSESKEEDVQEVKILTEIKDSLFKIAGSLPEASVEKRDYSEELILAIDALTEKIQKLSTAPAKRPSQWTFEIVRDSSDLITEVVAKQIK